MLSSFLAPLQRNIDAHLFIRRYNGIRRKILPQLNVRVYMAPVWQKVGQTPHTKREAKQMDPP